MVLDKFLKMFIPHTPLSPKSGAPAAKTHAVRCDLLQNPISVFAEVGHQPEGGLSETSDHNFQVRT